MIFSLGHYFILDSFAQYGNEEYQQSGEINVIAYPDGLVGLWDADLTYEISSATDDTVEIFAIDLQSLNDGRLLNGVLTEPGIVGNAFSFDGIDDYIVIPNNDDLNFGMGDFTVAAWIQTSFDKGTGSDFILTKSLPGNGHQYTLSYRASTNGQVSFYVDDHHIEVAPGSWSEEAAFAESNFSIVDGEFHYIAGVRKGTITELYVDGILVGTDSSSTILSASSSNNVVIGGRENPSSDPYFNGLIDEVQIYNRALSQSEIKGIFDAAIDIAGQSVNEAGPVIEPEKPVESKEPKFCFLWWCWY